jgi:hypothetical protein
MTFLMPMKLSLLVVNSQCEDISDSSNVKKLHYSIKITKFFACVHHFDRSDV